MVRWGLFILFAIIAEWYPFQAVRTSFGNKWINWGYLLVSASGVVFFVLFIAGFDRTQGQTARTLMTLGLFLLIYIPKLVMTVLLFGEDIFRLAAGIYRYFSPSVTSAPFLPGRRKFISQTALALGAVPFASIVYGILKGRYNYKVIRQRLYFEDLPREFDGFTVLQISDVHSGSFDNPGKIRYGIDLINEQQFDLFVFTGDIVNTRATEMDGWIEMFTDINTPAFGKFSILGNHDYGGYVEWPSETAKQSNFEAIKAIHPKVGFNLLLNENVKLRKGGAEISLIGTENWGKGFKQVGDLKKASRGIKKEEFKILLSHDPSHWDAEVQDNPLNYQLTLSGHTHGMQFGIEIPGFLKWSPAQYVYRQWAGMYENLGRYLYVNRGFGYHAYPGRVGIWPEITLIELRKKITER